MDWYFDLRPKIYSGDSQTINANSDATFDIPQNRTIHSILFDISNIADTDYENVRIRIMAGSVDKLFFDGTINDLLMVGYLQNQRNIVSNSNVKSLIHFDLLNDSIATPLIPYIEPINIKIENKTGNDINVKIGYKGVDTEAITNIIVNNYRKKGVNPTDIQVKQVMAKLFKKRVFLSSYDEFGSTTLQKTIPAKTTGIYDSIVVYQVSGNLKTMKLTGLDVYVEENDFETLTNYALLNYQLPPTYAPTEKFAIIENMPATMQYYLYLTADTGSKVRVITERVF